MRLPTLNQFFRHQVLFGFHAHGLPETECVDYISDILTRFSRTSALYALRDASGHPLEHLVDMQAQWRRAQVKGRGPGSNAQARRVIRHIGEYTLFMSGLFRLRIQAKGLLNYYLAHGHSAFWHCADAESNPGHRRVYRQLYSNFGNISNVLHALRRDPSPLSLASTTRSMLAAFWRV
jgi:hypothetical protein